MRPNVLVGMHTHQNLCVNIKEWVSEEEAYDECVATISRNMQK